MNTTRPNGSLYTEIKNRIATIEFGHPASNSFTSELLQRLTDELYKISGNQEVSVIVLRSEGERAFCAGASFDELVGISSLEEGKAFFSGFANVINAMRSCRQPIVGRIQGKTVGGGVGLAASTDYCMASKYAAIKLSELNIGIGPFVVGPAIERKIGLSAMSQIAIDANSFYPAEWAKQKGLFTHVFETTEELDEAVKTTAEHLCTYNTDAMREMKKVFWQGTDHWDELLAERAQTSGRLVLSHFTKEKLKGFK